MNTNFCRKIFGVAALLWAVASCSDGKPKNLALSQNWTYRAFGQSVDLFFANSANAPGQDGINNAWINPTWDYMDASYVQTPADIASSLKADASMRIKAEDVVVVESRGGKIAAGHDGMTFFYTKLPTNKNYIMHATMTITAAGPHPNNVGTRGRPVTSFQQQGGGGMIARDVVSPQRQEPPQDGMEELPAVSNFSAAGFLGGRIVDGAERFVNGGAIFRDGQDSLLGNVGVGRQGKQPAQLLIGVPYQYTLERTDEGYFVTITDLSLPQAGILVERTWAGDHDLTSRVNAKEMFWGIGMMREGRIVVKNIDIFETGKNTAAATPVPAPRSPATLLVKSHNYSTTSDYTLALFSNRNATANISHNGVAIAPYNLVATEELYLPYSLVAGDNQFDVVYQTEGEEPITQNITVVYNPSGISGAAIYASPSGNGVGTQANPAKLQDAINLLQPGQTLYLLNGRYPEPLRIEPSNGGLPNLPKTVTALNPSEVWINTNIVILGNYWHFKDLLVGGTETERITVPGGTTGDAVVNILGNYNTIERVIAEYGTGTGINIGNTGIFKEFFPKHNRILNSEARYNEDPAGNNADGFGAKRVGPGNYFYGSIAHHNVDDGWDLFNPIDAGSSEPVVTENSISYNNGRNGFKLGGESQPAHHITRNSLAFGNGMAGFSDNFNPGRLVVENNTSIDSGDQNFLFRDNSIHKPENSLLNNISWRSNTSVGKDDYISGSVANTALFRNGSAIIGSHTVSASDFVSITPPAFYTRDAAGEIIWGDFMRLSPSSPLRTMASNGGALGPAPLAN
jgi:pectate disaccharide-lyase